MLGTLAQTRKTAKKAGEMYARNNIQTPENHLQAQSNSLP